MVLMETAWHLSYYNYSFLAYIIIGIGIVAIYSVLYCFRVPMDKFPNLRDIVADDPKITEAMMKGLKEKEEYLRKQRLAKEKARRKRLKRLEREQRQKLARESSLTYSSDDVLDEADNIQEMNKVSKKANYGPKLRIIAGKNQDSEVLL